ncbi:hypothetical protein DRQ50_13030, partial [bacterium]
MIAILVLCTAQVQAQAVVVTGSYTGDGLGGHSITGLGFRPDVVLIQSAADDPTYARTATMAPGFAKDLGSNVALNTGRIESLDADGFSVGAAAETNLVGQTYYWVALRASQGVLDIGSYVGDGNNVNNVGGLDDKPIAILILGETAEPAVFRTEDMAAYESFPLGNAMPFGDAIISFQGSGFSVGTDPSVNLAGDLYHYIAWYDLAGSTAQGTYLGNAVDDRAIGGLGFAPAWVLVRGGEDQDGVHRSNALTGDVSHFFRDQIGAPDRVQDLNVDGFQVGLASEVNTTGVPYHWLALASSGSSADLEVGLAVDSTTVDVGDTLTITVMAQNSGGVTIDTFVINSPLPPGLLLVSGSPQQG